MKLKINWKELARQLWAAVKPVLLGALGGGLVGFASGCSSMAPSDKTQTMSVYALGIPELPSSPNRAKPPTTPAATRMPPRSRTRWR